jgi:NAD(P)-dependent dehydrogenase (short-subunit alcohol dehydrogenase family)
MDGRQTILIAGATGNVGGGAAIALAKRGEQLVLLGRSQERLNEKVDSIQDALDAAQIGYEEQQFMTLVIDFSDMESVRNAVAKTLDQYPRIHGLILSVVALVQGGPHILPSGHELMFATNVMGPFLFTELLLGRLEQSDGLVLHVINPSNREIDWDDLESIKNHQTTIAYERTKVYHRVIAGEMARRYAGRISNVAFDPTFIIDKSDPELEKRWPSGFLGFFWRVLTLLFAKPPAVAGEPMADIMLTYPDRSAINGSLFKLDKRIEKPDKAMNDRDMGKRLWNELTQRTGLAVVR